MASKFKRNARWYVSFKDKDGRWRKKSVVSEERADNLLRSIGEFPSPIPAAVHRAPCFFPAAAEDYLRRLSIYGKPTSIKHSTISCRGFSEQLT